MNPLIKIFGYRFELRELVIVLLSYLFMEGIFTWLFLPNSLATEAYIKLAGIFFYLFLLYRFHELKTIEKIYLLVFTLILIRLVIVSLKEYDTPFQQLTMFTVLVPVIYAFFVKYIMRRFELDLLEFIAKFYLLSYILFMLFFGRGFSFSLEGVDMDDYGPFSGDGRIVHASRVLMMIIPLLYFLHQYINKRKMGALLLALLCVGIIVIHQHRSVWSSALVAVVLYFFAMIRNKHISAGTSTGIFIQAAVAALLAVFLISQFAPQMIGFLGDRFSEILNPAREGSTGNFRIEQREVYSALFLQKPFFGWTFAGFEMSNPLVDWWPEMTGQHFHEGYIEMLFYHGIVGFIFKFSILFYLVYRLFSRNLSPEAIILMAFSISGLLFSFNYVLPMMYWGHVGMTLYYLELSDTAVITEVQARPDSQLQYDQQLNYSR